MHRKHPVFNNLNREKPDKLAKNLACFKSSHIKGELDKLRGFQIENLFSKNMQITCWEKASNPQQFQEQVWPCLEEQADLSQNRTKILGNSLTVIYEIVLVFSRIQTFFNL